MWPTELLSSARPLRPLLLNMYRETGNIILRFYANAEKLSSTYPQ